MDDPFGANPKTTFPKTTSPADDDFVLDLIREPEARAGSTRVSRHACPTRRSPHANGRAPASKKYCSIRLNPPAASQSSRRMLRRLHACPTAPRCHPDLVVFRFGRRREHRLPLISPRPGIVSPSPVSRSKWLIPAAVFIPLLIFLGWFYVRRATANEQALEPQPTQEVHQ